MNPEQSITQMIQNAQRIRLLAEVSVEQARWKPAPDSWSILEVINHLNDEEREDFRVRLDHILHQPDIPWPPIDPQGWVSARQYNQRSLQESVSNFLQARQESLDWLRTLPSPDWEHTATAPWGKPVSAGDMFAAWVAHDILHLRQLVELHWAYTNLALQPYKTAYAGDW